MTLESSEGGLAEEVQKMDCTEPEICLRIPDLFSGIMSPKIVFNPYYLHVKRQAELWFKE